tara:strand:+ start:1711 stop:2370 length:660 start_codon:yes stop_codon:yes gene_type:complete
MIDVIMPTYLPEQKNFDFFCESVNSLKQQTFKDFNTKVVFNGPNDFRSQVEKLVLDDDRFEFMYIGDKASGAIARNYGIKHSSSKYIAQLDADDLYHEDKLQQQFDFMEENDWCGFLATCVWVMRNGGLVPSTGTDPFQTHAQITTRLPLENIVCHGSVMFRRSHTFGKDIFYNEEKKPGVNNWFEDWDLWLRFVDAGVKFHKLSKSLYYWREGSSVGR